MVKTLKDEESKFKQKFFWDVKDYLADPKRYAKDGFENFRHCLNESIAAECFGLYRLARVALRSGLDDLKYRLYFQVKYDSGQEIKNEKNETIHLFYFHWSEGLTENYPHISKTDQTLKTILPLEFEKLIGILNKDTHYRSDYCERMETSKLPFYCPMPDITDVKFNEQELKHWKEIFDKTYKTGKQMIDNYMLQSNNTLTPLQ
ncbi:MAG: hypothetical protein WCT31_00680 [Candidatus Micrarchaeia archaeon]